MNHTRSASSRQTSMKWLPVPRVPSCVRLFDFRIAGWTTYHVYERRTLAPGTRLRGPALVVEDDTTTVVPTSFSARACPSGHLVLDRDPSGERRP